MLQTLSVPQPLVSQNASYHNEASYHSLQHGQAGNNNDLSHAGADLSQPIMSQQPGPREKKQPAKFSLVQFYRVKKRTLAFELDPETRSYRGQMRFDLALRMSQADPKVSLLEQQITECRTKGMGRVFLEAAVLAKQCKVVEVSLLVRDGPDGDFRKETSQKFADGHLADPVAQAKVNPDLYSGLSRHLYQLEDVQRCQERKLLTQGTVQLKLSKRLFQFKNADKIKPELHIMIDFMCEHIADVGGVKCVKYRRELADQLAASEMHTMGTASQESSSSAEYFFTSDEPNQSVNWLP